MSNMQAPSSQKEASMSRLLTRSGSSSVNQWFQNLLKTPSLRSHESFQHIKQTITNVARRSGFDGGHQGAGLGPGGAAGASVSFASAPQALDVGRVAQALNPAPIPAIPEQRGSYEMELQFNEECSSTKAANWTYSSSLQQVFVNMGHICPITIRTAKPIPETSLLRMYLKYQKDRDKDPVTRCPTHVADPEAKSDDAPPEHVLRSNNPNAQYRTDSRGVHCIILPTALTRGELTLQQTELIRIMCFSSCAGGIARRPLELIFEVSDGGQLLCRQSLAVRVCACPGRDRRNLEKSAAADVLSLLGKGDTGTSRSGKVKRAGVNKKKPLSLTRTVTAINMRGPQDDNDRTRYTINVVGHDNFLMAEKIAKALHDAQGDAVLPSTAPSEKQLQAITGVPGWLALWSLEKHADGFLAQGYDDIELLEHMDAKDIANVGIKSKADKQRFQEAVAHLVTVLTQPQPPFPCHNLLAQQPADKRITRIVVRRTASQA